MSKAKKTVNISAEEGSDLYNILCYLHSRHGNAKQKVIEALEDRYLPLVLDHEDPRLSFEVIERANNLEAAVKTIRERAGIIAPALPLNHSNPITVASWDIIDPVAVETKQARSHEKQQSDPQQVSPKEVADPVTAEREMVHKQELLDMGMRYE